VEACPSPSPLGPFPLGRTGRFKPGSQGAGVANHEVAAGAGLVLVLDGSPDLRREP